MSNAGLILFLICTTIEIDGAIIDLLLWVSHRHTISAFVRLHPAAGIPILLLHIAGVMGLAYHFWGSGGDVPPPG